MKPNPQLYTASFTLSSYVTKERWELSANYDEVKQQYYGVALETPISCWDNATYLYFSLLPFLHNYKNNEAETSEVNAEYELVEKLKEDEQLTDTLISMLERSKLMGWHRL